MQVYIEEIHCYGIAFFFVLTLDKNLDFIATCRKSVG